ncbi:hypothetical protein [Luteimonas abyssi]|uniref:hypothetical protein n=1 Tax=Luteimonas abyssi TaxID=1247514 RepID=UPI000737B1AE|nr:hypothetical protein [Luteimonas abyssi]
MHVPARTSLPHRIRRPLLAACVATVLAACSTTVPLPDTGNMTPVETLRVSATGAITAVDAARRVITVQRDNGETLQLQLDPAIQNVDRLEVGDNVSLDYMLAVAADIQPAGSLRPGAYLQEDQGPATGPGGRPERHAAERVTLVAPILAVDTGANTLTVEAPNKRPVTLSVPDPAHQAALPDLRVGDLLRVTFTEAVAIEVRPSGG